MLGSAHWGCSSSSPFIPVSFRKCRTWLFTELLPCQGHRAAFCKLCLLLETEMPQLQNHYRRRCFTWGWNQSQNLFLAMAWRSHTPTKSSYPFSTCCQTDAAVALFWQWQILGSVCHPFMGVFVFSTSLHCFPNPCPQLGCHLLLPFPKRTQLGLDSADLYNNCKLIPA